MKKFTMLAVAMALTLAPLTAMADETEEMLSEAAEAAVTEVNWSDVEEQVAEVEADFVTFDEIALKMWVPTAFESVELTDEDREQGYIGYYQTADESAACGVVYMDVDGLSLEDYAAMLAEDEEVSGIAPMIVNGIECLNYDLKDRDATVLAYATEAGCIIEFSFRPVSDENFAATAMFMMSSIQAEETEEAMTE